MTISINTNTYAISASTTSASVQLLPIDAAETYIELVNPTTAAAFFVTGSGSAPTAVIPTSTPVMGTLVVAGRTATYPKKAGDDYIAVILSAGSGTVYVSTGANVVI